MFLAFSDVANWSDHFFRVYNKGGDSLMPSRLPAQKMSCFMFSRKHGL